MSDTRRGPDESLERLLGISLQRTLRGHSGFIGHIAWSRDGSLLASPSEDKSIRIWNALSGECLQILEGHLAEVFSVSFEATGQFLASGSADNTVRLWDTRTGRLLRCLDWRYGSVNTVAFDPAGTTLAVGGDNSTITLWKASSGKLLRKLAGRQGVVNRVTFDPAGGILAGAGIDHTVNLWDAASGELLQSLNGHRDAVNSVAFDPAGRILFSGGADRVIKQWDVATGRLVRTIEGPTDRVRDVAVSCDGRLLAAKSQDGTVSIWRKESAVLVAILPEPSSPGQPTSLAFHPQLSRLATVGSDPGMQTDDVIHLWDLDMAELFSRPPVVPHQPERAANVRLPDDSVPGLVEPAPTQTFPPPESAGQPDNVELPGSTSADQTRQPDSPTAEMRSAEIRAAEMSETSFTIWAGDDRVTLAIVFTDITGSTALGQQLKDHRMMEVRRAHFAQSRKLIEQYKGRGIKTIGDRVMAVFRSVEKALDFATALQHEPGHSQIKIRAGIHIGPMQIEDNDVFGSVVDFAARVVDTITEPEIWLSNQAKEDLDRSGAQQHAELKWKQHQGISMKGFSGVHTLWAMHR